MARAAKPAEPRVISALFSDANVYGKAEMTLGSAGLATRATMAQHTHQLMIPTRGKGLYPFTRPIAEWIRSTGVSTGLLTIFIQHTSASLVIQENADPDVVLDLRDFFERLAPEGDPLYRHTTEGEDDMPAHIRAALTQTSLSIPVKGGRMALGVWQGIYVFEHRSTPMERSVVLHLMS